MTDKKKKEIRKLFGKYLQKRREEYLGIPSVRKLSFNSNLDQSKLNKIEMGHIDLRFDTLLEIAITYKIQPKDLFAFEISFWEDD
jgi:hypothetical protein